MNDEEQINLTGKDPDIMQGPGGGASGATKSGVAVVTDSLLVADNATREAGDTRELVLILDQLTALVRRANASGKVTSGDPGIVFNAAADVAEQRAGDALRKTSTTS